MVNSPLTLLCVDDDKVDRQSIIRSIKKANINYHIHEADSLENAKIALKNDKEIRCVILDYLLPGQDGIDGIKALLELNPDLIIVMVTGQGSETVAVRAIQQGALDYIPKDQITDKTIQKVIENALQKSDLQQKINEQQQHLKNFSRILAHDFMAPARSIKHFVEFLRDDIENEDYENTHSHLDRIEKSVQYMIRLMNSLRDYHRGDGTLNLKSTPLQDVVDLAMSNLNTYIESKNAQIYCESLPTVLGDSTQLIELFQNLINNALKFCQQDVAVVKISCSLDNNDWKITVKDNGIGIKEEYLSTVFKPFERLHGVDEYAGTGLGLSLCEKIVKRHGGKIWCQSTYGEGSAFIFTLRKDL